MLAITRILSVIFLLLLSFLPFSTFATTINPTAVDVEANPGSSSGVQFIVGNDKNSEIIYHFDVILVTFLGASESPTLSSLPSEYNSWIDVEPDIATIASGQTQEVAVLINPPEDFPDQTIILGLRAVGDDVAEGSVKIREGVVGLIFATIGTDGKASGTLADFTVAKRDFTDPSATFYTTLTNTGNITLKPTGTISIVNSLGKTVDVLELNPDGKRINPGQIRTFSTTWQSSLSVGVYSASLQLDSSSAIDGNDSEVLYLFPWWFIIVIPSLLILVLILSRFVWRKKA